MENQLQKPMDSGMETDMGTLQVEMVGCQKSVPLFYEELGTLVKIRNFASPIRIIVRNSFFFQKNISQYPFVLVYP